MNQFITYAQNREDVILNAYFKDVKKGFYIDIGANHPVEDSVTKHFYDKGWRGMNVEPIKEMFDLLVQERPEDINVKVGVSDKTGKLKLREYINSGLSTFSSDMKNLYERDPDDKTVVYKDVLVPVVLLKDLLSEYSVKHIHFMKIDVEGYEYEVLSSNDWLKYRPEMICIESNHQVKDWRPILINENYIEVWNDGLNDYYLAKESMFRKDYFSYSDVILLDMQIIPHHVISRLNELVNEAEHYKKLLSNERLKLNMPDEQLRLKSLDTRIKQLQHEKYLLSLHIQEQQRFRTALKLFFNAADRLILTQIENLRMVKPVITKRSIPRGMSDILATPPTSKRELLNAIRETDLKTYYSYKKQRTPTKFYLYNIVMSFYVLLKRLFYFYPKKLIGLSLRKGLHV